MINLVIEGYSFEYVPKYLASGGVGMYINKYLQCSVIEKTSNKFFQALWIEIDLAYRRNIICGVVYRQHSCPDNFLII